MIEFIKDHKTKVILGCVLILLVAILIILVARSGTTVVVNKDRYPFKVTQARDGTVEVKVDGSTGGEYDWQVRQSPELVTVTQKKSGKKATFTLKQKSEGDGTITMAETGEDERDIRTIVRLMVSTYDGKLTIYDHEGMALTGLVTTTEEPFPCSYYQGEDGVLIIEGTGTPDTYESDSDDEIVEVYSDRTEDEDGTARFGIRVTASAPGDTVIHIGNYEARQAINISLSVDDSMWMSVGDVSFGEYDFKKHTAFIEEKNNPPGVAELVGEPQVPEGWKKTGSNFMSYTHMIKSIDKKRDDDGAGDVTESTGEDASTEETAEAALQESGETADNADDTDDMPDDTGCFRYDADGVDVWIQISTVDITPYIERLKMDVDEEPLETGTYEATYEGVSGEVVNLGLERFFFYKDSKSRWCAVNVISKVSDSDFEKIVKIFLKCEGNV